MTIRPDSVTLLVLDSSHLAAIDDSQRLVWLKNFQSDPIAGEPVVARDSSIYIITKGNLIALDKSGEKRFNLPHHAWLPGRVSPKRLDLIVMTDSNAVSCNDSSCIKVSRKGDISWRYDLPNGHKLFSAPVAGPNGSLYLRSAHWLHVVGSDGKLRWKMPIDQFTP